jgi:hypothetical protein
MAFLTMTLILTILLVLTGSSTGILIPGPDALHRYKSAVAHFSLTDTSRKDPYAPGNRAIMLSLFLPVSARTCTKECNELYMPAQTAKKCATQFLESAEKSVFEKMEYSVCCGSSSSIDLDKILLVVLDPHTDTTRLLYATMARYLAANGVAVLTIDHPHDTSIVEYTDGTATVFNNGAVALSNLSPLTSYNDTVTTAVEQRILDITYALKSLPSTSSLFPKLKFSGALNANSYALIGHGLGGTVATSLAFSDLRVTLSINMAGTPPPFPLPSSSSSLNTTSIPVYFFTPSPLPRHSDILWPSIWPHLVGPATSFHLDDSAVMDFSDLPVIIDLAGTSKEAIKGEGMGSQGPWGNHAVKCFLEGVVRDRLLGDGKGVTRCVGMFAKMVPDMGIGKGEGSASASGIGDGDVKSEAVRWGGKVRMWIGACVLFVLWVCVC